MQPHGEGTVRTTIPLEVGLAAIPPLQAPGTVVRVVAEPRDRPVAEPRPQLEDYFGFSTSLNLGEVAADLGWTQGVDPGVVGVQREEPDDDNRPIDGYAQSLGEEDRIAA